MSDKPRATKRATETPRSGSTTACPTRASKGRSKLWPAGVHVAPYLSASGRFVLVAIGRERFAMVAAEVAALADLRGQGPSAHPNLGYSTSILEPRADRSADTSIPFLASLGASNGGRPLDNLLWPRGVHLAPWRDAYQCGDELGYGRPMMAIDRQHRLVAEMMVPDGADPEPVQRDLLAILEAVEDGDAESARSDPKS